VILTIYNLPPWLCHKRKYLYCIQGPKQPGIDIDDFLEPLLIDMKKLWEEGFRTWDEYRQEHFTWISLRWFLLSTFSLQIQITSNIPYSFEYRSGIG
jgi:hypothetical protein